MRTLVADDDVSIRELLTSMLSEWGYDVVAATNGVEACEVMQQEDAPLLAILDWSMPGMTGPEVIQRVRTTPRPCSPYLLLLTARDRQGDVVDGLRAGASDYIIKPFDYDELQARLHVGAQMVSFKCELAQRVKELEDALEHVRRLQGLLPICSYCRRIRDDRNYWHGLEDYISAHSEVHLSHGICPDCYQGVARPEIENLKGQHGPR